jgi:hypothetical protein
MNRILTVATLAAVLLVSTSASAQRSSRGVSKRLPAHSRTMQKKVQIETRMAKHIRRINAGIMDGSLTWSETRRLFRSIEGIDKRLHRSLRDRRISGRESMRMIRMLDKTGRQIASLRRNRMGRLLGPVPVVSRPDRISAPRPRELGPPGSLRKPVGFRRGVVSVTPGLGI